MYLAAELEQAGLVPAAELLSGLFASGALRGDLGDASVLLMRFWQQRHERFAAPERHAFYARLFGDTSSAALGLEESSNTEFESLMIAVTTALVNLQASPVLSTGAVSEVPLRVAASALAASLLPRSGGLAVFAARDLLKSLKEALAILRQREFQRQFGADSVWTAVRNLAQKYANIATDVFSHVTRGKAGMLVLAWVAESLPVLDGNEQLIAADATLPSAAASWLQANAELTHSGITAKQMA